LDLIKQLAAEVRKQSGKPQGDRVDAIAAAQTEPAWNKNAAFVKKAAAAKSSIVNPK
jgi:hypothetical protein